MHSPEADATTVLICYMLLMCLNTILGASRNCRKKKLEESAARWGDVIVGIHMFLVTLYKLYCKPEAKSAQQASACPVTTHRLLSPIRVDLLPRCHTLLTLNIPVQFSFPDAESPSHNIQALRASCSAGRLENFLQPKTVSH